jgi:hypothetical protein
MSLYAGARGAITFTYDGASTQMVAHLVERVSRNIVGYFSYPARTDYQLLTKLGNVYSGVLTEAMTIKANQVDLDIEIKAFVDTDSKPIGVGEVGKFLDNTVKKIDAV